MNERPISVEEDYFLWLCRLVTSVSNPNPSRSYFQLLEQMHRKRFTWFVPNDDNREADGKELRYEYLNGPMEEDEYCSFLEMLIALSRRAAFDSSGYPEEWFWHMAENAGLRQYSDEVLMETGDQEVRHILDRIVDRQYEPDGYGGLFPLDNPRADQRDIEIWYQMGSYILEGKGP